MADLIVKLGKLREGRVGQLNKIKRDLLIIGSILFAGSIPLLYVSLIVASLIISIGILCIICSYIVYRIKSIQILTDGLDYAETLINLTGRDSMIVDEIKRQFAKNDRLRENYIMYLYDQLQSDEGKVVASSFMSDNNWDWNKVKTE